MCTDKFFLFYSKGTSTLSWRFPPRQARQGLSQTIHSQALFVAVRREIAEPRRETGACRHSQKPNQAYPAPNRLESNSTVIRQTASL